MLNQGGITPADIKLRNSLKPIITVITIMMIITYFFLHVRKPPPFSVCARASGRSRVLPSRSDWQSKRGVSLL